MKRFGRQIVPIAMLILALGLNAQMTARAQWSQYQGDAAHTGFVAETIPDESLAKGWEKIFPYSQTEPDFISSLAVSDQGVFTVVQDGREAGDGGYYGIFDLTSFNRVTGQEEWQTPIYSFAGSVSAPSVSGNIVYVHDFGDSDISGGTPRQYPRLVGVNASTGQIQFATTHEGQGDSGSRPTVLGNQVVALGGYFGGMDSYDASTGTHQWFTAFPQQYGFIPAMDQQHVYVYYGSIGGSPLFGTLYVLDRSSGEIDYTIQIPSDRYSTGTISSVALGGQDDALIINSTSYNVDEGSDGRNQLTSFDLQHHTIKWSQTLGAFSGLTALAVANGEIAVSLLHSLQMMDEATGSDLWTWTAPSNATLYSNIVLTNNLAFVASQDTVFGIDRASGQLEWSAFLGRDNNYFSYYNLSYFDGTLYVSGADHLFTFNTVPEPSGVLLWSTVIVALFGYSVLRRRQGVFHVPTGAI
jgi:hypothetical protein